LALTRISYRSGPRPPTVTDRAVPCPAWQLCPRKSPVCWSAQDFTAGSDRLDQTLTVLIGPSDRAEMETLACSLKWIQVEIKSDGGHFHFPSMFMDAAEQSRAGLQTPEKGCWRPCPTAVSLSRNDTPARSGPLARQAQTCTLCAAAQNCPPYLWIGAEEVGVGVFACTRPRPCRRAGAAGR